MYKPIEASVKDLLMRGTVIPAHPLVLHKDLTIDEPGQRSLTRYYIAAGAGGVAVGVHTTQFEIRKPGIDLLEPVLAMAAEEVERSGPGPFLKVAGICGPTEQALREAELAVRYGYHLGLVSMGGLAAYSEKELIERVRAIGQIIPVFGFYLQPDVGGRHLSYDFWREFADIPAVHAIKVAAFNRYRTMDTVRAVCDSDRRDGIALYTGNDDNIVADLLTPYRFRVNGKMVEKRFVGGLLGHWAVWTQKAVELFEEIRACVAGGYTGVDSLLAKGIDVTDMNAAIFDAAHAFHGCIPGIHEALCRQGLMVGRTCLNPAEDLSPGQLQEIDRIYSSYGPYIDDEFAIKFKKSEASYIH